MSVENQRVAAVYRDGSVKVFGAMSERHVRPLLQTKQFSHYGAALEWADKFKAKEEAAAAKRGK